MGLADCRLAQDAPGAAHIGLLLLAVALGAGAAYAQVGGYNLGWWTVDGGGGDSRGGAYALSGAAGQLDAGTLVGGAYRLEGFDDGQPISSADGLAAVMVWRPDLSVQAVELPAMAEKEVRGFLTYRLRSLYPGRPEHSSQVGLGSPPSLIT